MANFLTEKAVFICDKGGVIRCEDSGNKSVTHGGAALLTTGATLKSKTGICQTLTAMAQGTPQPCKCRLSRWLAGFEPMKKSNGNSLLTDAAKNFCPVGGGSISVKFSGHVEKVTTGNAPSTMKLAAALLVNVVPSAEKNSSAEKISVDDKKISSVEKNSDGDKKISSDDKISDGDKKISTTEKISAPEKIFCPRDKNSERCETCAYPQTSTTIKNDSTKLFANYTRHTSDPANLDNTDRHYLKIFSAYGKSRWSYQSHHIICGNQVFAKHKELVRAANFFGYDINNALNCIRLVAREDDYGSKGGGLSASAYDAMSLSKIQWHVGGHSYKFSAQEVERIRARLRFFRKSGAIQNYAELLNVELQKIETALMAHPVCKNDELQRKIFLARMNNLSRKVKDALGSFAEKPQNSFPYYVSKEAFTFAFGLPRAAKIILVRRADDGNFFFERFRAERFDETIRSESGRKLTFKSNHAPKKFSLDTRDDKVACVVFCENVENFIFAEGLDASIIPFPVDEKFSKHLRGDVSDGQKFLSDNETEILIWLRDLQDDYQYTAPLKKIKERLALIERREFE